jgi:4-aminobutyrate aminotransferase-like enzyme
MRHVGYLVRATAVIHAALVAGTVDKDAPSITILYVSDVAILLRSRGVKRAAFVVDTIVSSGGVVSPPTGYLS